MTITSLEEFKKNIETMLEKAIKDNEPVTISTKDGNAVVISEEEYSGLVETLYLSSIPNVQEGITEGLKTPLSNTIPENKAKW